MASPLRDMPSPTRGEGESEKQKSYTAIVAVLEQPHGATGTGCNMLNLRGHLQTWSKWFCKVTMGGGKKNTYHACRTLIRDTAI
eukprot:684501-Prorocentrum_lima.AAC.1